MCREKRCSLLGKLLMVVDVDEFFVFILRAQQSNTSKGNKRASTVNESNYNKRILRKVAKISYCTRNVTVARARLALRAVVGFRAQRVASYYSVYVK